MFADDMEQAVEHNHSSEPDNRDQFLTYSRRLTLDSNTLSNHLQVSERNRVIRFSYTDQRYPHHPDRFNGCQVLCRERVCGRSYWEIDWSGHVFIAVSYKSIRRKDSGHGCDFGRNDQSWRLFCSESRFSFCHNDKWMNVPVVSRSDRIGVYVDERAGILSFYSVSDSMKLIHSINTTFTKPLYAGFGIVSSHSKVKLCD